MMNGTYRAIKISKPGAFTEVSRPLQDPGPNQVRIRVEACGVCHTDSAIVGGEFPPAIVRRLDVLPTHKERRLGRSVNTTLSPGKTGTVSLESPA
jgi:D-arabinose 1-dehydrogenase-like Zn-dependent alcohol dehydrogenase